jgi:hypothetical protein
MLLPSVCRFPRHVSRQQPLLPKKLRPQLVHRLFRIRVQLSSTHAGRSKPAAPKAKAKAVDSRGEIGFSLLGLTSNRLWFAADLPTKPAPKRRGPAKGKKKALGTFPLSTHVSYPDITEPDSDTEQPLTAKIKSKAASKGKGKQRATPSTSDGKPKPKPKAKTKAKPKELVRVLVSGMYALDL